MMWVVMEWLVRWFCLREPRQALPVRFGRLLLRVTLPLAGLAYAAREAFLLVMFCFFGLILILLICMLVLRISLSFEL